MHWTHMDVELQRRIDGAVHKFLGKERNTVIEIQKMDFTNCRKSKSRRFVAATVANGNQASKVSKVHWQEAFDSESGTRISEPCQHSESTGDCVVLRMRKAYSMSLLGRSQGLGAYEPEGDPAH